VQRKSPYAAALPDGTSVLGKLGNGIRAFREEVALRSFSGNRLIDAVSGNSFLRNTVGMGTDTMKMYHSLRGELRSAGTTADPAEYPMVLSGFNKTVPYADFSSGSYPFRVANASNYFPGGTNTVPTEQNYRDRASDELRRLGSYLPWVSSAQANLFADQTAGAYFDAEFGRRNAPPAAKKAGEL